MKTSNADRDGLTTQKTACKTAYGQDRYVQVLELEKSVLRYTVIEVLPESYYRVTNVAREYVRLGPRLRQRSSSARENLLDGHQTNTGQDAHYGKQLPEFKVSHQLPATNIYTVRSTQINTLHVYLTSDRRSVGGNE